MVSHRRLDETGLDVRCFQNSKSMLTVNEKIQTAETKKTAQIIHLVYREFLLASIPLGQV